MATDTGDMFGLDGLIEALNQGAGLAPEELLGLVVGEIELFAAGYEPLDDQTLLLASLS